MTPHGDVSQAEAELPQPLGHPRQVGASAEIDVVATGHGHLVAHGGIADIGYGVPLMAFQRSGTISELLGQCSSRCSMRAEPRERRRPQPFDDAAQLDGGVVGHSGGRGT